MTDWSGQVHMRVRRFVKMNACPTCGSRVGLPCKNTASVLLEAWEASPEKKRTYKKQKRKTFYFSFVHIARRTAVKNK